LTLTLSSQIRCSSSADLLLGASPHPVLRRVILRTYRCKLSVPVVENSVRSRRIAVTAMQQIADWLKKLGMSEYAERFAKNDIEIDNLTELTITTWKGSASPARSSRRRAGQGRLIQSLEQRAAASGPEASERHGPTVPAPPLNNGKRLNHVYAEVCGQAGSRRDQEGQEPGPG